MSGFNVDRDNIPLDVFLHEICLFSVRKTKFLISSGRVIVNGAVCKKKKRKLYRGDRVEISWPRKIEFDFEPEIINGNFLIYGVYKPPFFHSTEGKRHPNMEDVLGNYFNKKVYLLNRLDFLTSGILMFGFSEKTCKVYKRLQGKGLVEKGYIALVYGKLNKEVVIKNMIYDDKRKKVLVSHEEDKDILRHTRVIPKRFFKDKNTTLVEVWILKGRRHQIRSHLSYIGHPIVGDPLYGKYGDGNTRMYLHNFMVRSPEFVLKINKKF